MIQAAHVCRRRAEPGVASRHPATGELARRRQGQEPHAENLSDWPAERIALLRAVLRGETLVPAGEGLAIVRALPHGHVSAALGTARRIGLDRLLPRRPERRRKLALALIVARLIDPAAKLATARALDATTAIHSLGATLGLGVV